MSSASFAALVDLVRVDTASPALVQAQVKALSKQIPLLFFITVVNTLAVAVTHYGTAPGLMTVGFPIVITIGYVWRGVEWAKLSFRPLSDADAGNLLKLTVILGPGCSLLILIWALALFGYGDPFAQGHILFYAGVTVLSCTFCMMHLRPAALLMTGVTVVPFSIYFLASGRPVFIAVVISMLLVSAAMIYILFVFSRDFAKMVDYQQGLLESTFENARIANTDSLTNLPNRRQFLFALQEDLEQAARDGQRVGVGIVNLDGFKTVNDLYGNVVGDSVLKEAARRLRAACEPATLVARLGADEFGILVDDDASDAEIGALGARICGALQQPFAAPGVVVEISGSSGFATFPQGGSSAAELFERARYALSHAKQHSRGHPTIFSTEHETEIRYFANLELCLAHADFEAEMFLHFQPIVDVVRGKTVAFEALARWISPSLGRVAPDVFIGVAERSDIIHKLTATLLRRALAQAKAWPAEVHVSFNLSARDIASREAIANIAAIIESSGVAPGRIDIEVTETAMFQDFEQASLSLRMLKAMGVQISLDDFGTGYSSLSYVRQFPLSKIKIDRSFVKDVETDGDCRAIVKSVIDMCRNLKLACIVEGMETERQVSILRGLGGHVMQGYVFGKPMPASEVAAYLAAADLRRFGGAPEPRELSA